MQQEISKKVAIVTGASSGIGKALAKYLLLKLNYKVILIARDIVELQRVKQAFLALNSSLEIALISADVADYKQLKSQLTQCIEGYGHIDLLINSAGYAKRGTSELEPHEFMQMINTNLVGSFNLIHLVCPYMKKQKSGRIINISSISGVEARAEIGGYAASKFGLMGLNESLHQELAAYNISVTAVCPNLVATNMTKDVTTIPPSEFISVDEIVKTVEFILSTSNTVMIKEIVLRNRGKFLQSIQ